MIIFKKSVFFHTPKCGGTWIRNKARSILPDLPSLTKFQHTTFDEVVNGEEFDEIKEKIDSKEIMTWSLVRHPIDWAKSYWAFKTHQELWHMNCKLEPMDNAFDETSPNFETFMSNWIDMFPDGVLNEYFSQWTGSEESEVQYIGKSEWLRHSFIHALSVSGEEFDVSLFEDSRVENGGNKYMKRLATMKGTTEQKFKQVEQKAIKRFGYE